MTTLYLSKSWWILYGNDQPSIPQPHISPDHDDAQVNSNKTELIVENSIKLIPVHILKMKLKLKY